MNDLSSISSVVAEFDRQRFRARLGWLIRLRADSSRPKFARLLSQADDVSVDGNTVQKWIKGDPKRPNAWIGGKSLWAIRELCQDVTLDWLMGFSLAKEKTERFIDRELGIFFEEET